MILGVLTKVLIFGSCTDPDEIADDRPQSHISTAEEGARRVHGTTARRRVRTARGACGRLHSLLRHDARQ